MDAHHETTGGNHSSGPAGPLRISGDCATPAARSLRQAATGGSIPSSQWTNTRLVEACLGGNEQAWHAMVDRYQNLIYSIPLRQGLTHEDAADIFQAVWLDLFNELARLRNAEALQGWLIRVTTHKCYRWKRQQSIGTVDRDEEQTDVASEEGLPPDVMAEVEREQSVREAIGALSSRCAELIELLFFQQPALPYFKVAQRLGLATGSIGFIRGRCLKRLKQVLEEKGF